MLIKYFRDLSIRHKLMILILFVSVIVLLLSSSAFIINDLVNLQTKIRSDLAIQTRVIAENVLPSLDFDDAQSAADTLKALSQNEKMILALVYAKDEFEPFAFYLRQETDMPVLLGNYQQHQFFSSHQFLQYSQPLVSPEGNEVGSIVLILDYSELHERVRWYIAIAIIIVFVAILIALLLSARLQRIVTHPILSLVEIAYRVSTEKDYSLRLNSQRKDELGVLFRGFNDMLGAIEERDEQLAQHREHLEKVVAERTAELKKLNLQLRYQAYHDALTNLPNRALFIKRVEQTIEHASQHREMLAVLFIDLDRFKYINDTLGHAVGDLLLQEVAKRLLACTRQPTDMVARLGGDEFTLLLRDIKDSVNAGIVAEHIIKVLTNSFKFNLQELYITPSIGISLYPKDGEDVGSLMKHADAGMYMAKKQGRNNYRFYTSGATAATATRLNMENKLRQALEYDEFEVWYQPRFDVNSKCIVGAEALIRWQSPEFSLVSPGQFIPVAEDTGLIIPIGEWVLRTACQESLSWQQNGHPAVEVSVNLSARQFVQEDLLSNIESIMGEIGIDPHHLELELTESLIMPNAEETIETLCALKTLGIQLSVDDFGTGYSSLSYLKRFPIDILKIDQSFVQDIHEEDTEDHALVTAIIAMAHNLKLTVVAEGVETEYQWEFLKRHHCDYAQGFLFGRPMPAKIFRTFLSEYCPEVK